MLPEKRLKIDFKKMKNALPGMAIAGTTGGLIGAFMGKAVYIVGMACIGALLGYVVWSMGGQRFFLFIVVGALLGGASATYLSGYTATLLGAATGGAIGGFLGVNLLLLRHK